MSGKAHNSFWLDGGYDFESVQACVHHPSHKWQTFRVGDLVEHCYDPDERLTICVGCYVPRCGSTTDADRCTLWRHHQTAHVMESGAREPMGTALTGTA
jgi:hypothetical protein